MLTWQFTKTTRKAWRPSGNPWDGNPLWKHSWMFASEERLKPRALYVWNVKSHAFRDAGMRWQDSAYASLMSRFN